MAKFEVRDEETNEIISLYGPIGTTRLLDIEVYYDDELIYEGMVEDAPEKIKDYKYYDVKMNGKTTLFYISSKWH